MLTFTGDKELPLDPKLVWERLRDAAFLVHSIPDATVEGEPTRDQALATVRPGLAFMRGSLDVTLNIVAAEEPTSIKILASSKGIGASSEVEVTLTVTTKDAGSHVNWRTDVKSLGGLLKMVPTGLIRGAAQKVIADLWVSIEKRLA